MLLLVLQHEAVNGRLRGHKGPSRGDLPVVQPAQGGPAARGRLLPRAAGNPRGELLV